MVYSAGASTTYLSASSYFPKGKLLARKIETSDPAELDEKFLREELAPYISKKEEIKDVKSAGFSKPRGPARKPR